MIDLPVIWAHLDAVRDATGAVETTASFSLSHGIVTLSSDAFAGRGLLVNGERVPIDDEAAA